VEALLTRPHRRVRCLLVVGRRRLQEWQPSADRLALQWSEGIEVEQHLEALGLIAELARPSKILEITFSYLVLACNISVDPAVAEADWRKSFHPAERRSPRPVCPVALHIDDSLAEEDGTWTTRAVPRNLSLP
jgi:hypothetical protein